MGPCRAGLTAAARRCAGTGAAASRLEIWGGYGVGLGCSAWASSQDALRSAKNLVRQSAVSHQPMACSVQFLARRTLTISLIRPLVGPRRRSAEAQVRLRAGYSTGGYRVQATGVVGVVRAAGYGPCGRGVCYSGYRPGHCLSPYASQSNVPLHHCTAARHTHTRIRKFTDPVPCDPPTRFQQVPQRTAPHSLFRHDSRQLSYE